MNDDLRSVIDRRAQLLAELFLQELGPTFISRPTKDVGYDLPVGFANEKRGVNTFAIQLKATERMPAAEFQVGRNEFDRIVHSNVPALLFVADVKRNVLYYAWLRPAPRGRNARTVSIALTELNDEEREALGRQLRRLERAAAVAG